MEGMEEAESGEIARWTWVDHTGCVGNEDHWWAGGIGVSGHVRNGHTFIPPLCKEKGVRSRSAKCEWTTRFMSIKGLPLQS